ncbi:MAG TPA: pilus assembly protein PilM [Acidimicrobiia bacterium]|jgi:type IV pilus assembly protein PilM
MAERVVGLDVGTAGVRVADVEPGPRPVLRAFGHVDLPPGAVRGGEVVDPDAVADAIRRLWRETGLRQRSARVGVASERVVVRTIELPSLSDAELAGALQFEAQDYVPFPVDESILDFHVLERITGVDGEPVTRILLAAAHKETVGALLGAVKAAGVTASAVDLVPLALIRGLRTAPDEPGAAEAVVSVGAGVTTVVVHEGGLPRLVRIVAVGGEAGLARITVPIHGSLDYYLNQTETTPLMRVLLTGGGSLTAGLAESIVSSLGVAVEQARPRANIDVGDIGVPESQLSALDPYLAVAVGLALGGPRAGGPQIDLLPPEARREAAGRRATRRLALVGAVLLVALVGLSLFQVLGASGQRDRLADQQRTNRTLQARVDELGGPLEVQQNLVLARQRVSSALAGDVSWPRVLEDLAATLPASVWLDSFSLQLAGPAGAGTGDAATAGTGTAAGAAGTGGPMGTASFTATALDFPSVAAWLDRLPRLPYYLNLSVSSVSKAEAGTRPVVTFTSGATVGPSLRSDRLQRLLGPEP